MSSQGYSQPTAYREETMPQYPVCDSIMEIHKSKGESNIQTKPRACPDMLDGTGKSHLKTQGYLLSGCLR